MNIGKDYAGDLCKSHSARSEKEFCRVCPSNLNKKELENVYFTLLENNFELKTTINRQCEKIKILSTKVQRLTTLQKTYLGKEPKECCSSKAIIDEQKGCISELKKSNQCLSERVRQLNMRLCSVKQFLKRSPFQSTSRCIRCSNKNASTSALVTKRSETNLRTTGASSQYLVKDIVSSRTADDVIISHEKGIQYDFCDENKCRNRIDELTKENDDLQQELLRTRENHNIVTSQLERDVCDLRVEKVRVRSDCTLAEDRSKQLRTQLSEVTVRLGSANLRCDELTVELAIEKRKVSELETQLKAADMSCRIAHAIEAHLTNIKMAKDHINITSDFEASVHEKRTSDDSRKLLSVQSPLYKPKAAVRTKIPQSVPVDEVFKNSDDSGYTEVNKSLEVDDAKTPASTHINQLLLEKIADLQNQVNKLKAFKNMNKPSESLNVAQELNTDNTHMLAARRDEQQMVENIISESSDSVITEKKVNTKVNLDAFEHVKNDKKEAIEPKTQTVAQVKNTEAVLPARGDSMLEQQQQDYNVDTELRKNLKDFESRSQHVSRDNNALIDSRKLSLQDATDCFKEKILSKTGSLDENRIINIGSAKRDGIKIFAAMNITPKENKTKRTENQTRKSNNNIVANITKVDLPDNNMRLNHKGQVRETGVRNDVVDDNRDQILTNFVSDVKRKDSDSSKGTYTIHKDENLSKLKLTKETHHPYTLAGDVKNVLHSAISKHKAAHRRRTPAGEPRTHLKAPRDGSPDSTECEISSLSDLPSERDDRSGNSRSPGEERPPTASQSLTTTTTDYGSLSEGELPYLRDTAVLSDGEKRPSSIMRKSHSAPAESAQQLEAALAAVQHELVRCSVLLEARARRPLDGSPAD